VSFGKNRIAYGFGDLAVEMDRFENVTIEQGKYKGEIARNVPKVVKVKAGKTPKAAGGKPLAPYASPGKKDKPDK